MKKPLVGILMGSDSDLPIMEKATEVLKEMGISYEMEISSAHRLPEKTANYAKTARRRGIEVVIHSPCHRCPHQIRGAQWCRRPLLNRSDAAGSSGRYRWN